MDQDFSGMESLFNGDMHNRYTNDYGVFMSCRNSRAYDESSTCSLAPNGRSPNMNQCCGYNYPLPKSCGYPQAYKYLPVPTPVFNYSNIIEPLASVGGGKEKFSPIDTDNPLSLKNILLVAGIVLAFLIILQGSNTVKNDYAVGGMVPLYNIQGLSTKIGGESYMLVPMTNPKHEP